MFSTAMKDVGFSCWKLFTKFPYPNGIKIVAGKCSKNEVYMKCGSDCGHTCDDIMRNEIKCPEVCLTGCFCKPGYFRDGRQNGRCVRSQHCKTIAISTWAFGLILRPKCPDLEEYKCGTNCGNNCDDIGNDMNCANS
ncbi:unnamed protein product, partial [Medioppia subpectinata]